MKNNRKRHGKHYVINPYIKEMANVSIIELTFHFLESDSPQPGNPSAFTGKVMNKNGKAVTGAIVKLAGKNYRTRRTAKAPFQSRKGPMW